jgi:hypothetical protein
MSRRFAHRLAPAAALAATLALATPAHAWPDPARLTQKALQWIASLWPADTLTPTDRNKTGAGVDPNGSPPPATSTTTPCTGDCERGGGIDPDG